MTATMPGTAASTTDAAGTALRVVGVDELGRYAADWDALADHDPLASPFLRSWWLTGAAARPGERGWRPHLLLVLDGEDLVGGLALERRRRLGVTRWRVLTGGKLCPDHLDLLCAPGRLEEVSAALRSWLTAPGGRLLDLDGLREDAAVIEVLGVLGPPLLTRTDIAPHEPLTGDVAGYLAARSATFRRRNRRWLRAAEAADVRCRRVEPVEVPAAMAEFCRMHELREDRKELLPEFPRLLRAVERGVAADEVWVYVATKGGTIGAVMVLFVAGGRSSIYQTARRLEDEFNHIGSVLTMAVIEDSCARGDTDFDFLRGSESYKASYASDVRPLLRARVAHGRWPRAWLRAQVAGETLRSRAVALRARLRGPRSGTGSRGTGSRGTGKEQR